MDDIERGRLLTDAIILERAWRVLERRQHTRILTDPVLAAGVRYLSLYARQWREEAERDGAEQVQAAARGLDPGADGERHASVRADLGEQA